MPTKQGFSLIFEIFFINMQSAYLVHVELTAEHIEFVI